MSAVLGWMHRFRVLLNPEAYAREVEREIRFHIELEAMQRRGVGLDQIEAEIAARRQFGNVTYTREEVRRMTGMEWLDRIRQNVGYAIRGLRRSPGFTLGVVATLGLGLGVNAAMYSFLDRVFVRPPAAITEPAQVRRIYAMMTLRDATTPVASTNYKYPHVRNIVRQTGDTTVGVFVPGRDTVRLTWPAGNVAARRMLANTSYFRTLGVRPALGRYFDGIEDRVETPAAVAVISHSLWRRGFHGDSGVIGRVVKIRDRPVTIIGVAAPGFAGIDLDRADMWMPINNYNIGPASTPAWYDTYRNTFGIIARFETADEERAFLAGAQRGYRATRIPRYGFDTLATFRSGPLSYAAGPATRDMEVSISLRLAGVAAIVLVIALANVSNLLLLRAARRSREIAVRRALGVSRLRLFEQALSESMVLALISGLIALILATWVGSAMRALLLPRVHWATGVIDGGTLAFAGAATLIAGLVVGMAPAAYAWRPELMAFLKAGAGSGGARSRIRSAFLVAQMALSVVLLVGASLFVRSLGNVRSIDLGYDIDRTMIVSTFPVNPGVTQAMDLAGPALIQRLLKVDGVEAVAASNHGPMRGISGTPYVRVPGVDSLPVIGTDRIPAYITVTPDYFRASGLRLVSGRTFAYDGEPAIIVSHAAAKAWWPGVSPLTKCVVVGKDAPCLRVVGVAADVHRFGVLEKESPAMLYRSSGDTREVIVLRADPKRQAVIADQIRSEIKRLVPQVETVVTKSMYGWLEDDFRPWRLGATLFTSMGVLALIVAAIGVYSVIAYSVSQQATEMGIRIALGAHRSDISRLVVGEGLRTIAVGIAIGVALALAGGKLIASLLYGISPRDPVVMITAAIILGLIGVAASVIPALRAARVDPMTTLRVE